MKAKAQDSVSNRWPTVRLGDVCEVFNGLWKGVKPPFRRVGVIRATNFTKQCKFDATKTAFIDVEEKKFLKRKLRAGDIIVERSGGGPEQPVGRAILFDLCDGDYSISNFTSALRIKNSGELLPNFLQRYLTFLYVSGETLKIQTNTIQLHNLDFAAYLNFTIPLPPLAEQRKIVAKLEKDLARVEAMRVQFERMATAAEDLFKATLAEEFAKVKGDKVRLGDVFKFIDYRGITPHKVKSGIPLITARNVRFGYMDYSVEAFITKSDYAVRQTRGIAHKGDILFTTEAPLGFVAIADKETFSTGQRIITFQWLNDSQDYCAAYHLYYMMSDRFQDQIAENATGALAQGIKSSRLINLIELLPPLAVQREIVARLDAAKARSEGMAARAREAVATCEKLRKAILAEAFQ